MGTTVASQRLAFGFLKSMYTDPVEILNHKELFTAYLIKIFNRFNAQYNINVNFKHLTEYEAQRDDRLGLIQFDLLFPDDLKPHEIFMFEYECLDMVRKTFFIYLHLIYKNKAYF